MAMKVFNLTCDHGHVFEGWFASHDAWADQSARRLVACPICSSTAVTKMLSAPRLNLGATARRPGQGAGPGEAAAVDHPAGAAGQGSDSANPGAPVAGGKRPASSGQPPPIDPVQFQQLFLAMARKIIASTEDVGDRFVDEARKIHHQEAPERAIRGSATREQAAELHDEGIEVFALPLPDSLKGPLQ